MVPLKPLTVRFIDNTEVELISHGTNGKKISIIPLSQRSRDKRKVSRQSCAGDALELSPVQEEAEEENKDVIFKPTELLEEREGMVKNPIAFGFNTPKKRWSMLEKAGSARKTPTASPSTPTTPRLPHLLPGTPRTPASPSTPKTPRSASRTPKSKRRLSGASEAPTPYSFRKRVQERITKIVLDEDSSSSSSEEDDDDDSSSYSDSDSEEDESKENLFNSRDVSVVTPSKTPRRTPSKVAKTVLGTPGRTPSRTPGKRGRQKKIKDVEMVAKGDDYFMANGNSKAPTSDHTLNRLETPRLSPEALQSILSSMANTHLKEREALIEENVLNFPRWMTYLCEGFSIFLYGLGSKKQLLSKFQQEYLSDYDHIVINGFFPSLTLKNILNNIIEDILEHTGGLHGGQDQLDLIEATYTRPDTAPLFIIIHNLDGAMLRGEKTQAAIARLASLPRVHVLASLDHINAPLILDSHKMSQYNIVWFDATTLERYQEETSYENSLLVQQSGSLALSSLIHVFKSLTPNAKGIFMLLAKHQLEQKDNSSYTGLSFSDMYQRCRESFLVNSDLTLRAQLTEFRDHKLLRSRKGHDGVENLIIPLPPATLQDFVTQQELENE
ncbi:hypothetical protein Pcinc_017622 [Petrolisthes cinctipes]|uniref:Origin recognition complex subunit 2 n=1 Tax=Petrolisthes cinctipes TaxID=88211 RepID=A0AAE1KNK3_PETCI|nr:hypothetical protein Pcinc_017622 [Petrolisthes cinctipes]